MSWGSKIRCLKIKFSSFINLVEIFHKFDSHRMFVKVSSFKITLNSFVILFLASSPQGFYERGNESVLGAFMTLSDIDIDIKHNNNPPSAADYLYDSIESEKKVY